jgi:ribosome-binding factor A
MLRTTTTTTTTPRRRSVSSSSSVSVSVVAAAATAAVMQKMLIVVISLLLLMMMFWQQQHPPFFASSCLAFSTLTMTPTPTRRRATVSSEFSFSSSSSYTTTPRTSRTSTTTTTTQLAVSQRSRSSSSSRPYANNSYNNDRSKRQERVGHLVRTELSQILHRGNILGRNAEPLDDELRQRISIVSADVSPDLRQARISVSIRASRPRKVAKGAVASAALKDHDDDDDSSTATTASISATPTTFTSNNPAVDKRRAYSWLVRNNKALRHSLAQRLSHIKTCPQLSFVQVDIGAAVDVMQLIDQVTSNTANNNKMKRETIAIAPESGKDDEFFDSDEGWIIDDDDDFF